jgi:hypothetical protein
MSERARFSLSDSASEFGTKSVMQDLTDNKELNDNGQMDITKTLIHLNTKESIIQGTEGQWTD